MNMGNSFGINNFGQPPVKIHGSNSDNSDECSSSSSESEDESTKYEESTRISSQEQNVCLDNNRFRSDFEVLTPQKVELVVEPMLSINELISLVFLLYDSKLALQNIMTLIAAGPKYFQKDKISVWARSQQQNWQAMLIEALAIIQNYKILKKLGYDKEEIKIRFQPTHNTTLYISRVKKMLFRTIECLYVRDARSVGELLQFKEKFQPPLDLEYKYMEFHLLLWAEKGYISIDRCPLNLDKLLLELERLDSPLLKNIVSELKAFLVKVPNSSIPLIVSNQIEEARSTNPIVGDNKVEYSNIAYRYPVFDPDEVGLLIIINIEKFHLEPNPKFKVSIVSLYFSIIPLLKCMKQLF